MRTIGSEVCQPQGTVEVPIGLYVLIGWKTRIGAKDRFRQSCHIRTYVETRRVRSKFTVY